VSAPFDNTNSRTPLPRNDGESAKDTNTPVEPVFREETLRPETRIHPVRISDRQVVLKLRPGGSNGRSLMIMGLVFAAIPGAIGYFMLRDGVEWIPLAFLSGFLLIGLTMVVFGLRMMFTRTLLLLESGRLVLRKLFFGWTSTKEYILNDRSVAQPGVAYEQNNQPVYHVEVTANDGHAKFGLSLDQADQRWLVDGINSFLGTPVAEQQMRLKEKRLVGNAASVLRPQDLPAVSIVSIDRDDGRDLHLSWTSLPPGRMRTIILGVSIAGAIFVGGFAVHGVTLLWNAVQRQDIFMSLFSLPFIVIPLTGLLTFVALPLAQTSVHLSESSIRMGIGRSFLSKSKQFPLTDVTNVIVADPDRSTFVTMTSSSSGVKSVSSINPGCVVRLTGVPAGIPLTIGYGEDVAREVAGLIRFHLERNGVSLPAADTPVDEATASDL